MIVWFRSGVWWSGKTPDTSPVPDSSPCITMVAAFRSGENKSTRPTRREPLYIKVWCLVDLRPYGEVWKAPDTPWRERRAMQRRRASPIMPRPWVPLWARRCGYSWARFLSTFPIPWYASPASQVAAKAALLCLQVEAPNRPTSPGSRLTGYSRGQCRRGSGFVIARLRF